MRILFAGTPGIAVPALRALAGRNLVGAVLTNPDKPGCRGSELHCCPVKAAASELGLPVLQPDHLGAEARKQIAAYECDSLVCFAYGRLFGPKFLALFPGEKLNVHPSLLPALRGSSPIQGAILSQLERTGISIQRIAPGMDEGDIVRTDSFPLDGTETTGSLTAFVADRAVPLVLDVALAMEEGRLCAFPQSGEASYTSLVDKRTAVIDWSKSARELHAFVRAMLPWPKASTTFCGKNLMITSVSGSLAEAGTESVPAGIPSGTVIGKSRGRGVGIATGDGILWVDRMQLEKRKELDWQSFVNGNRTFLSCRLG